ncbi:exported hypothetical protein [Gammaproteobacteria bacterium]
MKTQSVFIATIISLCLNTAHAGLNDGLVAYYPFNGNANDESGKGNNGQAFGATLDKDRLGKQNSAYLFDGSSNYIQLIDNGTLGIGLQSYSIAAWIKPVSPTNNGRIFSKGSSGCVTGYMMRMGGPSGNHLHLENAFNGQCHVYFYSNQDIVDGNWHFVVGAVDRSVGAKIYIDGNLDSSQEVDTSSYDLSNSRNPTIGKNDVDNGEHFNGNIDDVRIYNRALSAQEVTDLFQNNPNGTAQYSEVTTIPDVNGDGIADQALLALISDKYYLRIINSANGKQLRSLRLGSSKNLTLSGIGLVPDINGDGATDFALLVLSTGNYLLRIVDGITGNQLKQISLGAEKDLTPVALTTDQSGHRSISILIKNLDGTNVLQIRNAVTLSLLKNVKLPNK